MISFGTEMSPIADWKRREEDSNVVSVSTNVGTADKPLQTPYRDDFWFILLEFKILDHSYEFHLIQWSPIVRSTDVRSFRM